MADAQLALGIDTSRMKRRMHVVMPLLIMIGYVGAFPPVAAMCDRSLNAILRWCASAILIDVGAHHGD